MLSEKLDIDDLEQAARSAYLDHEHRPNRYYFDDRSRIGNEPVGGYGYNDELLAIDLIHIIAELRASRKVVEAARKIDELQGWDASGTTTTPRFAELHAALRELTLINVRNEEGK